MAKPTKKSKAPVEVDATEEETEEGTPATGGVERVLNRTSVQPNWSAFSRFIEDAGGPKINPKHVGIVLTGYKYFQKSDAAVEAREEASAAKEAAREEREAARELKAKERAQAAKDKADRAAARDAKAKAGKKTAAASSKSGTKATKATKATPAKKKGKKAGKKSAF